MIRAGLFASLMVLIASGPAAAQSRAPSSAEPQLAAAHYQIGMAEYRAGHFQRAAAEFRAAYEQSHDAALLFNVGSALFDGGDLTGAQSAFEEFLRVVPNAPNRPIVEGRLATIRQRLGVEASSSPPPGASASPAPAAVASAAPSNPTRAPSPQPAGWPVAPFVVAGVGVIGLGLAGMFYGLRAGALNGCTELPDAFVCTDASAASNASTFGTLTEISFAVGGAALLGGVVWLLVDRLTEHGPARSNVSATLSGRGPGVLVGVRF
jgi:tetratricopeptide (TPR) repeat protein